MMLAYAVVLISLIHAASLHDMVASSTATCHKSTPFTVSELQRFVGSMPAAELEKLSERLVPDPGKATGCSGDSRAAIARCVFGENFNRHIVLLKKFNINASHLQILPKAKAPARNLDASAALPWPTQKLDFILMGAADGAPHLLPMEQTLTVVHGPFTKTSGGYSPLHDPPLLMFPPLNSVGEDGFTGKGIFFHELCHAWAHRKGNRDVADDWLAVSHWRIPEHLKNANDLSARKESIHQFTSPYSKKAMGGIEPEKYYFVSDYANYAMSEDYADSCVAARYGINEFGKSSPIADAKVKLLRDTAFQSENFAPGSAGCSASSALAGEPPTGDTPPPR